MAVITSLPPSVGAEDVLAAYRYRWQVELYFKRFKTLLEAGEVPKKRADCMEAWLNGKMLLSVLYEVLLSKLDFSPLGPEENQRRGIWRELSFFVFIVKSNLVSLMDVIKDFVKLKTRFLVEKRVKTRRLQLQPSTC